MIGELNESEKFWNTHTQTHPWLCLKSYNVVSRDAYFENSREGGGFPPTPTLDPRLQYWVSRGSYTCTNIGEMVGMSDGRFIHWKREWLNICNIWCYMAWKKREWLNKCNIWCYMAWKNMTWLKSNIVHMLFWNKKKRNWGRGIMLKKLKRGFRACQLKKIGKGVTSCNIKQSKNVFVAKLW